jgi:hypothetical protein
LGFDGWKIVAGIVLYVLAVGMPTVGLILVHNEMENPIFERVLVGVLGVLAGGLIFQGLYGRPDPTEPKRPMFWGFNPFLGVVALVAFYLAWLSNFPGALAGNVDTHILVVSGERTLMLDSALERVIMSGLTFVAVWALIRTFRTPRTPEERRQLAEQRRLRRTMRADRYSEQFGDQ